MNLKELLDDCGLDKLLKPLTSRHYSLDMLTEFVNSQDSYMLDSIRQTCGISLSDMEKLKKAVEL